MVKIKLSNIKKQYSKSKKYAVEDFSLDIYDNEFVVIVGPSGCGKTTLLRMIAGLESITSGKLFIDGKDVTNLHPKDRDIAMVFQSYALYPHLSVYDNIAFPLKMRKVPKDEIKDRVFEISKILGLDDYLSKKPKELSGGQRQRVAIGRAMIKGSSVFLLDEPLSNLDAKLRNQMRFELKELSKKLNASFIYVTHDQVEAMTLGDRIVVMNEGKIAQVGTPIEVYNNPNSKFVASFIGSPSMNLLDGKIIVKDKNFYAVIFGKEIKLSKKFSIKKDREVILGIRPKDITFSKKGIEATVIYSEILGSEVLVHLDILGNQIIALKEFDRKDSSLYKQGDKLFIDFPEEDFHIFDKKTGCVFE